jgi:hypothetical protein
MFPLTVVVFFSADSKGSKGCKNIDVSATLLDDHVVLCDHEISKMLHSARKLGSLRFDTYAPEDGPNKHTNK